ncbi:MAG: single-stranded-DNA-specific exonuclease, partial [Gaiellaceae bacterium]|nr:single-stranded-DNA-specific exonuclease [Gaiellaceae bacterium]
MHEGTWTLSPCPPRSSSALAKELDISEITASVLVRRGYGDPEEARAFLAGEQPLHDPFLLGDMAVAVERIRAAIAAGKRICVHGDYDVDGIAATTLAVLLLRELGADVDWHLPSRFDEGYGVRAETLARSSTANLRPTTPSSSATCARPASESARPSRRVVASACTG